MVKYRLNRRGYLFIIDAFIALSVLIAGFFFVFTFYSANTNSVQQKILARDVINHLMSTRVEEYLDSSYNLTLLANEGEIKDIQHTVAEELLLDMKYNLYRADCRPDDYYDAGCALMQVVMEDYVSSGYNIVVTLTYKGEERNYYRRVNSPLENSNSYYVEEQILYVNDYKAIDDTHYRADRVAGPGLLSVAVW